MTTNIRIRYFKATQNLSYFAAFKPSKFSLLSKCMETCIINM